MPVIDRSFSVMLDGKPFSFSGRMRLRGEDELSLFPALFTLELWNLPEEYFLRLFRAKMISVSHDDACLVSGSISDVFRQPAKEGVVTTVAISLGLDLWESTVSLTVPANTSLSDTIRQILAASGTGICLLADLENDSTLVRPQSFFGRAAECVSQVLARPFRSTGVIPSEAEGSFLRAMLTPSGIITVPPDGLSEAVKITESDLTDTVAFSGGSLCGTKPLAILSATVAGWRPGQTVEVQQGSVFFRGIIVSRSVDADTASGPWKSEMIVEVV